MDAIREDKSDATLVRAAQAGDGQAFERLVGRHFGMVYAIAYSRLGVRETAEDLAQEVFLRAFLFLDRIERPAQFTGWLARITQNLATDWARRQQRASRLASMVPLDSIHENIPDERGLDARETASVHEQNRVLRESIFRLPLEQRDLVLLHYVGGLTRQEIATRLEVHPATVGRDLKKALAALKESLESALQEALPALCPSRGATTRTLAVVGAVSGLSAATKAALTESAGGVAWLASAAASGGWTVAAAESAGLLPSLEAALTATGRFLLSGKGIASILATSVLVAAFVVMSHSSGTSPVSPSVPPKSPAPVSPVSVAVPPPPETAPASSVFSSVPPPPVVPGVPVRVLHFPKDRSLGQIHIQTREVTRRFFLGPEYNPISEWEFVGEAKGDVSVPADKRVTLKITSPGTTDLSALAALGPTDLYRITVSGYLKAPSNPDEAILPHLRGLKGLRVLQLWNISLSDAGLQYLKDLPFLEVLSLRSEHLTGAGMVHLEGLRALRVVDLDGTMTDVGLMHLGALPSLRELSVNITGIGEVGMAHLSKAPSLEFLILYGQRINNGVVRALSGFRTLKRLDVLALGFTDADMEFISRIQGLEELNLHHQDRITDRGLVPLKSMTSLKDLDLWKSKVTDAGMAQLRDIQSLESLMLPHDSITDRGLSELAALPNLKRLWLPTSHTVDPRFVRICYTDAGLEQLARLQKLENLFIGGIGVTDTGMESIAKLPHLRELTVTGASITDEGLAKLATLQTLESLDVNLSKISAGGLSRLNALPNLKVLRVRDAASDGPALDLSKLTRLENLSLYGPTLRDEDLACLASLTNLRWVQLDFKSNLTDAALENLVRLTGMVRLSVGGPGITDAGLARLAGMKQLEHLTLAGDFTDDGLRQLERFKALEYLSVQPRRPIGRTTEIRLREALPALMILDTGTFDLPVRVGVARQ